ncbi:MAG: WG repeat-containing protein [Spirochaetales bacterium]|nr:WG repeat-containing protein [Spirochaetales bacterium]
MQRTKRLILSLAFVCALVSQISAQPIVVQHQGKYGYLDENLDILIPPRYQAATAFIDGIAVVQMIDGMFHIIDRSGNSIATIVADEVRAPSDGMILFERDREFGFVDYNGIERIVGLRLARDFNEGKAFVEVNGRRGYIDSNAQWSFPNPQNFYGAQFSDGMARVWRTINNETRWGVVNDTGTVVIEFNYFFLGQFSDGLAEAGFGNRPRFARDQQFGYINRRGEVVIEPIYYNGWPFENGVTLVQYVEPRSAVGPPTHYKVIDITGETIAILDEEIHVYSGFRGGYALIGVISESSDSVLRGFLDTTGTIVVEPVFSDVVDFMNGYWIAYLYEDGNRRDAIIDTSTGDVFFVDELLAAGE